MHETALMAQLLDRVEREARLANASRVTRIRLKVGELAGVEPGLLESAFQLLGPGTIASRATLEIESVPLTARCETCDATFPVERFQFRCPTCQGGPTRVVSGEELVIESITIASTEPVATEAPCPRST